MEKHLLEELKEKIKDNRKYKTLSDEIVLNEIDKYLKKNSTLIKPDKEAVKEIRKNLHRIYSSYQTRKKFKRTVYLDKLKKAKNKNKLLEVTKELLSITLSTKERLKNYPLIYKKIFALTNDPKRIIDIGSGLNPLSYPFMDKKELVYHAYDIDESDIDYLNNYFSLMKKYGLNGYASILDINDFDKIKNLPDADIVFMFKLIDILDTKKNKVSEGLLKILKDRYPYIVISFATKTLTQKNMFLPKRIGFELMLKRIGLKFDSFSIENEIFYIVDSG
jgi:hypothetical protein